MEVFGGGAYKRDSAYVDFFDNVRFRCALRHCLGKRVEVNDDHIDGFDAVASTFVTVLRVVAPTEYSAEDAGVKCLDASAQNRWVTGNIFYSIAPMATLLYPSAGTAGGEEPHAFVSEYGNNALQGFVLVIYRDECCMYMYVVAGHCV